MGPIHVAQLDGARPVLVLGVLLHRQEPALAEAIAMAFDLEWPSKGGGWRNAPLHAEGALSAWAGQSGQGEQRAAALMRSLWLPVRTSTHASPRNQFW